MDFTPIELAGKTYRMRLTPDDVQLICRTLTQLQPPGGRKVAPAGEGGLGDLLMRLDPDAIQQCLLRGLSHIREYKDLDGADVQALLTQAIQYGQQYSDFRRPIFRCLIDCGLGEFKPIIKILDRIEREQATMDAEAGDGGDPLATTSSTPPLRAVESAS